MIILHFGRRYGASQVRGYSPVTNVSDSALVKWQIYDGLPGGLGGR